MKIIRFVPILVIIFVVCLFFSSVIMRGKLPIPADTIVGLYHPYRDFYASNYPQGIPFKNFLITDPVRQQYPWRMLSLSFIRNLQLPLWNQYAAAGTPLLANFQTGVFYPLNLVYLLMPFQVAWTTQVMLEPLLASFFLYLFLRKLHLQTAAALLAGIVFAFCGFSVSWMTWNTLSHVGLWLPLILLSIEHLLQKRSKKWIAILVFAEISSIFAGHLQTLFYCLMISNAYLLCRIYQETKREGKVFSLKKLLSKYKHFVLIGIAVMAVTSIQWIPTLQFISLSARDVDQGGWQQSGWFIPWQNLIQFVAPDFFGNPATLNYWGVWNYAEFVGYVGILPLVMAFFALFFRKDKKTLFFGTLFFLSLIFSLPTIFAQLPFVLSLPFLSTAQPTRLLFITDFSLAILAGLGLDSFLRREKGMIYILSFFGVIMLGLWFFVLGFIPIFVIKTQDLAIAKNNLLLPTLLFVISVGVVVSSFIVRAKRFSYAVLTVIFVIVIFDLLRFATKFTPFVDQQYLYPITKTVAFLKSQEKPFRIMTTDDRILPPNFSSTYGIESIDVYDPLYIRRYGEFIAASERGGPSINPPFGYNRIIAPHNTHSPLINLLNVKYILSLNELQDPFLKEVFREGETRVYENMRIMPRSFFVKNVYQVNSKQEAINFLYRKDFDYTSSAVVEGTESSFIPSSVTIGEVGKPIYAGNSVRILTRNSHEGFLVLADTFYPTWHAYIQTKTGERKELKVIRTDYNFRGVLVPSGENTVIFYDTLLAK